MAEIVLIHGIGAENSSADSLLGQWLPALAGGVRNAGHPDLAQRIEDKQITVAMAFYGKLFLPEAVLNPAAVSPGTDGAAAQGQPSMSQPAQPDQFTESLAETIVKRAADPPGGIPNPDTAGASAAVKNAVPAGGDGSASRPGLQNYFLEELDKLPWIKRKIFDIAEDTVVPALKQVGIYMNNPVIQENVQKIVGELVGDDTKIIIGHSLGSVVAFNFVTKNPEQSLPLLLTLGSPLGDRTLVYEKLVPHPPVYPPNVTEWMNISARNDPVAAQPDLVPLFGKVPPGCQLNSGWTVIDEVGGAHAILDYLNQVEVGDAVAEYIGTPAAPLPASGS